MDLTTARALAAQHRTSPDIDPVCYIAGPMRGYPHFNFPAFEQAALVLREGGWFVYAPHENDIEAGLPISPTGDPADALPLKVYMAIDLAQVCKSDAVFMLDGWCESKGAALEFNVAEAVDIPCYTFDTGGRIEIIAVDGEGQLVSVDHSHLEESEVTPQPLPFAPAPTTETFSRSESGISDWTPEQVESADEWWKNLGSPKSVSEAVAAAECGNLRRDITQARPVLADDSKATNPKDAVGSSKLPLHLWPETATATGCLGLLDGMLKYGRSNWRVAGVRYSIYIDALKRHINGLFEGEDFDPDSGLPHLSHILACAAIIVDAQEAGKLTDDRAYPGGYRSCVDRLTPEVERLKAKYADRDPQHYDIRYKGE